MLLGSNDDINVVGETVKDLPNQNECKKDDDWNCDVRWLFLPSPLFDLIAFPI